MTIDFKTMTVFGFLKMLNEPLKALEGLKYGTDKDNRRGMSEVHSMIQNIIVEYLPEGMRVSTWNITTDLPTHSYVDVFRYDVELQGDKRFAHRAKGKILRAFVEPVDHYYNHSQMDRTQAKVNLIPPDEQTTIQQWFDRIEETILNVKIHEQWLRKADLERQIKDTVGYLDKYQDRLAQLQ